MRYKHYYIPMQISDLVRSGSDNPHWKMLIRNPDGVYGVLPVYTNLRKARKAYPGVEIQTLVPKGEWEPEPEPMEGE